jgi:hypothetical protein
MSYCQSLLFLFVTNLLSSLHSCSKYQTNICKMHAFSYIKVILYWWLKCYSVCSLRIVSLKQSSRKCWTVSCKWWQYLPLIGLLATFNLDWVPTGILLSLGCLLCTCMRLVPWLSLCIWVILKFINCLLVDYIYVLKLLFSFRDGDVLVPFSLQFVM